MIGKAKAFFFLIKANFCSEMKHYKEARTTHFDVKLHFGDEQFEVDAAQLSIAFTEVTLWGGGTRVNVTKGGKRPLTALTASQKTCS